MTCYVIYFGNRQASLSPKWQKPYEPIVSLDTHLYMSGKTESFKHSVVRILNVALGYVRGLIVSSTKVNVAGKDCEETALKMAISWIN